MRKPQAPQAPLAENGGQIRILFYYFKIGPLAFQSGTNSRRTTFSGGVGVHILKFIWQKILPEKNPACRQFEVFSSPAKKLGTSYSETTHLFGLKLWLQGVLMRALSCRSFRSNRCLVSEYEVPNFLGSQELDIFWDTLYELGLNTWGGYMVWRGVRK